MNDPKVTKKRFTLKIYKITKVRVEYILHYVGTANIGDVGARAQNIATLSTDCKNDHGD